MKLKLLAILRRTQREESGVVMLITLLVLIALTVLGMSAIFLTGLDNEVAISARAGDQALYVAEAGINRGADLAGTNPAYITSGYKTTGWPTSPGLQPPGQVKTNAGTVEQFPGGQLAQFDLWIHPEVGGSTVQCGLVGYSDNYGQLRFEVDSIGYGPGQAQRQIEAHIQNPPQLGLCPPSGQIAGGYHGGG